MKLDLNRGAYKMPVALRIAAARAFKEQPCLISLDQGMLPPTGNVEPTGACVNAVSPLTTWLPVQGDSMTGP